MHNPVASDALPTPEQMRNFYAAAEAAWQTRRLREASRAVVTGNIASAACLLGVVLVIVHSDWFIGVAPFVACGVLFGYLACLLASLRLMRRRRSRSSVKIIDRREADAARVPARPMHNAALFLAFFVFQALTAALWITAFRSMPASAILAALAIGPALAVGFFVYRFAAFRFWEDLLFAAAVVMSFTPFFLQAWRLTALSFLSLALVIVGAVCLHRRWANWASSLPTEEEESVAEGAKS